MRELVLFYFLAFLLHSSSEANRFNESWSIQFPVVSNQHDVGQYLPFILRDSDNLQVLSKKFCTNFNLSACDSIYSQALRQKRRHSSTNGLKNVVLIFNSALDIKVLGLLIQKLSILSENVNAMTICSSLECFRQITLLNLLIDSSQLIFLNGDKFIKLPHNIASLLTGYIVLFDEIFQAYKPSLNAIIIHGESNAITAAAIAAHYLNIPVIHLKTQTHSISLGPPTNNDLNRKVLSTIASKILVSSMAMKKSLLNELKLPSSVAVIGNPIPTFHLMIQKVLTPEENRIYSKIASTSYSKLVIINLSVEYPLLEITVLQKTIVILVTEFPQYFFVFMVPDNIVDGLQAMLAISPTTINSSNNIIYNTKNYALNLLLLSKADLIIIDSIDNKLEDFSQLDTPYLLIAMQEGILKHDILRSKLFDFFPTSFSISQSKDTLHLIRNILYHLPNTMGVQSEVLLGDEKVVDRMLCHISPYLNLSNEYCIVENLLSDWKPTTKEFPPPIIPRIVKDENLTLASLKSYDLTKQSQVYFHPYRKPGSITVILTQYKRNTTLSQLDAIRSQSIISRIDSIIIYQNEEHINLNFLQHSGWQNDPSLPPIQLVQSKNHNFKFHGRFTLPLLIESEYTVIFDDDSLPQPFWMEYAIYVSMENNAIVGAVGMMVGPEAQYLVFAPIDHHLEVDYVGHSWVFKTDWVKYLWQEHVPTWECCEDIGFSAAAWIHGRIKTIVPAMPLTSFHVWGDSVKSYHTDGKQSYTRPIPAKMRWPVTRYWIDQGWIPTAIRNIILGQGNGCATPLPPQCQATYDILFKEKIDEMTFLKKFSHRSVVQFIQTAELEELYYTLKPIQWTIVNGGA